MNAAIDQGARRLFRPPDRPSFRYERVRVAAAPPSSGPIRVFPGPNPHLPPRQTAQAQVVLGSADPIAGCTPLTVEISDREEQSLPHGMRTKYGRRSPAIFQSASGATVCLHIIICCVSLALAAHKKYGGLPSTLQRFTYSFTRIRCMVQLSRLRSMRWSGRFLRLEHSALGILSDSIFIRWCSALFG